MAHAVTGQHLVREVRAMISRLREWWVRRRARRDGTIGLYDWWNEDRDLRHNGGHVHNVGPLR